MDNFNFYSPTEFVFGKQRENECGAYVKKYGGSRVLIHYGGGSAVMKELTLSLLWAVDQLLILPKL